MPTPPPSQNKLSIIFGKVAKSFWWNKKHINSRPNQIKLKKISISEINEFQKKIINKEKILPSVQTKEIIRFIWFYSFLRYIQPDYRLSEIFNIQDAYNNFTNSLVENRSFFEITILLYPETFKEIKAAAANTPFLSNTLLSEYSRRGNLVRFNHPGFRNCLFTTMTQRGLEFNQCDYEKMKIFASDLLKKDSLKSHNLKTQFQSSYVFKYLVDRYEFLSPEMRELIKRDVNAENQAYLEEKLRGIQKEDIEKILPKPPVINKKNKI